jgi:hypothetical protein
VGIHSTWIADERARIGEGSRQFFGEQNLTRVGLLARHAEALAASDRVADAERVYAEALALLDGPIAEADAWMWPLYAGWQRSHRYSRLTNLANLLDRYAPLLRRTGRAEEADALAARARAARAEAEALRQAWGL